MTPGRQPDLFTPATPPPGVFAGRAVIVCGGRAYTGKAAVFAVLDSCQPTGLLVHGAARGVDSLADAWATARSVPVRRFPAPWAREGNSAGPLRNAAMLSATQPAAVIAFPGGKGTRDMVQRARAAGVPVYFAPF